ncbi:hypothetical protein [Paenibacillus tarimensis]|uniref:hypothetical protein n=1 Tax=Paenibacillus tarimensis TaxID=416012 RepID=UPI001F2F4F4C|nr:hypothetical protein [Paenibacillus tarimensis]MCF2944244.1 hypothetical protein [Paenibacillus tarimensis]
MGKRGNSYSPEEAKVNHNTINVRSGGTAGETVDEHKEMLVNEFLQRLADDPAISSDGDRTAKTFTIAELLYETQYPLRKEYVYSYDQREYAPAPEKPVIDLALLLNLLFKEQGLSCTFEDLMKHVLDGGKLDDFLKEQQRHCG